MALRWIGGAEGVESLYGLLDSDSGGVRVAAAMSLLQILEAYGYGQETPVEEPPAHEAEAAVPEAPTQEETVQPVAVGRDSENKQLAERLIDLVKHTKSRFLSVGFEWEWAE